MIKEAVQHGYPKDTKECEEILKDMLSWDKLLPALDVQTMMEEAKSRWLRPNVIHAILCNHKYFPIYMKPVNLPKILMDCHKSAFCKRMSCCITYVEALMLAVK
ncbi:hypothetical protein ES319_D11G246700v1 [Gossypium barbadense]|uniref:Uncharacterized protein n=2 Tax=Gossypium TaxID=3633 RepID=A0A5J5PFC0_GOSBA|nr:hypothetical protein ES319_D11G246700v1 [Gossypium barbadense]TYG46500.1 hypothetical protein ES288_D11G260400v1 [Gossypium darwinii]